MKMSTLSSQFHLPTKYLATSTFNPSFLIPTTSQQKHPAYPTILSSLPSQFHLPTKYLATSTSNPSFLIPTTSQQKHPAYPTILSSLPSEATSTLPPTVAYARKSKSLVIQHEQVSGNSSSLRSRHLIMGVVSVGVVVFLMGMDGQKAMALVPEGPLMEEFWDNVRRYGLYALTVSTGALYATFQPIYELLKNPISAILVLVILAGGIFILSQVVSAMVGVSDFTYDYGY